MAGRRVWFNLASCLAQSSWAEGPAYVMYHSTSYEVIFSAASSFQTPGHPSIPMSLPSSFPLTMLIAGIFPLSLVPRLLITLGMLVVFYYEDR